MKIGKSAGAHELRIDVIKAAGVPRLGKQLKTSKLQTTKTSRLRSCCSYHGAAIACINHSPIHQSCMI